MWTQSNKDQFATALLDKDNNHSAIRRNTCASISADESKLSDCHFFWGFLKNPGLMEPDGNFRRWKNDVRSWTLFQALLMFTTWHHYVWIDLFLAWLDDWWQSCVKVGGVASIRCQSVSTGMKCNSFASFDNQLLGTKWTRSTNTQVHNLNPRYAKGSETVCQKSLSKREMQKVASMASRFVLSAWLMKKKTADGFMSYLFCTISSIINRGCTCR